jgi:hypothetical protein
MSTRNGGRHLDALSWELTSRRSIWLAIGQCRFTIRQTATTGYWSMSSALHFIEVLFSSKSEETRLLSNH